MKAYVQPFKYKGCDIQSITTEDGEIMYSIWAEKHGGSVGIHGDIHSAMIHIDMLKYEHVQIFHIKIASIIITILLFHILSIIF